MIIDGIRRKVLSRRYEFSRHALDQSILRNIRVAELEQALIGRSELIEDYPDDKYGPSCLLLGFTTEGRPLHVLCSYPNRSLVKIITLYDPDPNEWEDNRVRKIRYWGNTSMKETTTETTVTYTLEYGGKFYVIEHVPARVCQETGEEFFSPETVEHIHDLVKGRGKPRKIIETPVYEYAWCES